MSNLSQFAGYREVPLIPDFDEPGFATSGYGQNPIWLYNQSAQMQGYYNWPDSEHPSSSYFNASWNSAPGSSGSWTYAGTTLCGPHGHLYTSITPPVNTNARNTLYLNASRSIASTYYGVLNSQATGIWVNKTKRDNLCIQRANNPNDYGSYLSRTQISMLGYGAYFAPITSTMAFSGYGSGVANGYDATKSYGCIGYNETTKMFVVTGSAASSTGCTLFVYKNTNAPTLANTNDQTFWNQFNHSTKITINFTFPTYNDTHDYQHYKLIPLDNGNIALIAKIAHSYIGYWLFTGNNGVNSTSWTLNASPVWTVSTTTSYHDSNFTSFDFLPATVSPDGKYVFVWTQYYYYQSGICGFAIRVSDGKALKLAFTSSSYPMSPVLLQQNTILVGYGANADGGQGMYMLSNSLGVLFDTLGDGGDMSGYLSDLGVDLPYTSTQYPMIWQQVSYLPNFIRGVF